MSNPESKPKRPYFRPTTPAQRRLLFETYEATGEVAEACAKAHVGRGTFYYWRPRFEAGGYEALEQERSRAPHRTRIPPIKPEIVEEVVAYKRTHPEAGYRTVAQRVRQAHNWQAVIGPSKVRLILLEAGLVKPAGPPSKVEAEVTVVHAPQAEQTVNIDLCVVPISHEATAELVSTSLAAAAKGTFSPGTEASKP
jgi:transposase